MQQQKHSWHCCLLCSYLIFDALPSVKCISVTTGSCIQGQCLMKLVHGRSVFNEEVSCSQVPHGGKATFFLMDLPNQNSVPQRAVPVSFDTIGTVTFAVQYSSKCRKCRCQRDRLAGKETITSGYISGRSEVLRSSRHCPQARRQGQNYRSSTGETETQKKKKKRSARRSSLKGRGKADGYSQAD